MSRLLINEMYPQSRHLYPASEPTKQITPITHPFSPRPPDSVTTAGHTSPVNLGKAAEIPAATVQKKENRKRKLGCPAG